MTDLAGLDRSTEPLLVHLYWPTRLQYFRSNIARLTRGLTWEFTATPGHGVEQPTRPTLNFFVLDETFLANYRVAAQERGFSAGLVLRRAALEEHGRRPGFELANVEARHPRAAGVEERARYWKYDVPNHRFGALGALRSARVVRLATPLEQPQIQLHSSDVVAQWRCVD